MAKMLGLYMMPHPPIVIPQVGGQEIHKCQDTHDAMVALGQEIGALAPKRILVISPHGTVFSDGLGVLYQPQLYGNLKGFGYEEIEMTKRNDMKFVDQLVAEAGKSDIVIAKIDAAFADELEIPYELDHGALVPLTFIDQVYDTYDLVHLTYGLLAPHKLYEVGMVIKQVIKQSHQDTVIIASGDLSHALKDSGPYVHHPQGQAFDHMVVDTLNQNDFYGLMTYPSKLREQAKECGYRSLCIGLGTLDRLTPQTQVLSYEGPFGVGYLVAAIRPTDAIQASLYERLLTNHQDMQVNRQLKEDDYVKFARAVINHYVKTGRTLTYDPKDFAIQETMAGCFVSIKSEAGLRGCIGTIFPTRSTLIAEIEDNAIKACSEDPRFDPVDESELPNLHISVDVLEPPEAISSMDELDPAVYGVIVTADYKKGLLLPMLEGVDTAQEQVRIAKSKAGITDELFTMERFRVIRHEADE